ncbi:MAG: sulfite exporter TauE/SafE family protein [Cyanobacteria bacterium P01_C01_bin.120]
MNDLLLTALILFGATLVSATFGFGGALFAMPLLTFSLGIPTATPLYGLVGPTISGIILLRNWQFVELSSAWRLVLATLAGIPIGVWLVTHVSGTWVTHLLGILLIGFGIYRWFNWELVKLESAWWAMIFGLMAGVFGSAYNTNGPPVIIYGEMRRWSPTELRATLQGYFFPTGLAIIVSHALGGLWHERIFQLYGVSLPGILLAIAIGSWFNQRLPTESFQSLLSGLLILLGVMLWF